MTLTSSYTRPVKFPLYFNRVLDNYFTNFNGFVCSLINPDLFVKQTCTIRKSNMNLPRRFYVSVRNIAFARKLTYGRFVNGKY